MGLSLPKLLRDLGMYPDHWYSPEEVMFHHTSVEKESRLVERAEFHEVSLDASAWGSWLTRLGNPLRCRAGFL